MNGKKIITLFGIDIRLHYSWWFVFVLLGWSLSTGYFPQFSPGLSQTTYWVMGLISTILLFASVVAHEIAHSLVALWRKLRVQHITLFFFGGVSSIPTEDIKPSTEFFMAAAGPLFSLVLALSLFSLTLTPLPLEVSAVLVYLSQLNLLLGLFNLLPGYPLDGGRVFRALLMFYFHDIRKATHIAAIGGKVVGGALAMLGVFGLLGGGAGGLWLLLLGGFLFMIAGLSYDQVLLKEALDKISLKSITKKSYHKLSPNTSIASLLKAADKKETSAFIVEKAKQFLGVVDLERLRKTEYSATTKVEDVMIPAANIQPGTTKDTTYQVFSKLMEQNLSLLPLISKKKVVGIVRRNTLLQRIKFHR